MNVAGQQYSTRVVVLANEKKHKYTTDEESKYPDVAFQNGEFGKTFANLSYKDTRVKISGELSTNIVDGDKWGSEFQLQIYSDTYSENDLGDMPSNWVQLMIKPQQVKEMITHLEKIVAEMDFEQPEEIETVKGQATFGKTRKEVVVGKLVFFNLKDRGIVMEIAGEESSSEKRNPSDWNRIELFFRKQHLPVILAALKKFRTV
jgi:hypothetical protein